MEDLPLFDAAKAREARDAAMASVSSNADGWLGRARTVALTFRQNEFTGEDLRAFVLAEIGPPHHPNTWGALVLSMVKSGAIVKTGRWVGMKDVRSHNRQTPVYRWVSGARGA